MDFCFKAFESKNSMFESLALKDTVFQLHLRAQSLYNNYITLI